MATTLNLPYIYAPSPYELSPCPYEGLGGSPNYVLGYDNFAIPPNCPYPPINPNHCWNEVHAEVIDISEVIVPLQPLPIPIIANENANGNCIESIPIGYECYSKPLPTNDQSFQKKYNRKMNKMNVSQPQSFPRSPGSYRIR